MSRWRLRLSAGRPEPLLSDLRKGASWPREPEYTVPITTDIEGTTYRVDIEVVRDKVGVPVVTGVAMRRVFPTVPQPRGRRAIKWDEQAELEAVSPRDLQRAPWSTWIRAARALVGESDDEKTEEAILEDVRQIMVPKGRPERGKGTGFYRDIVRAYNELARIHPNPIREIARRKRVRENTVHQWLYRARQLFPEDPDVQKTRRRT